MAPKKIVRSIVYFIVGFTIANAALVLLSYVSVAKNLTLGPTSLMMTYHYSDGFTFYATFFGFPIITGLVSFYWLKRNQISDKRYKLFAFLALLQVVFTIYASIENYNYWGYAFKRPTLFSEIHQADSLLSNSYVSNGDFGDVKQLEVSLGSKENWGFWGRDEFYFSPLYRPIMAFQDNGLVDGTLYEIDSLFADASRQVSGLILENIDPKIRNNPIIDLGDGTPFIFADVEYSLQTLYGRVVNFVTSDGKEYVFAGLRSLEVSNDHFAIYEFLFEEQNGDYIMLKKQRFYMDISNVEGWEYAYFSPRFSVFLILLGLILGLFIVPYKRATK